MNKDARHIVKVQISLMTTDPKPQALLYNRDRSLFYQEEATPELIKRMNSNNKLFFFAHIVEGKFKLGKYAPWQNW